LRVFTGALVCGALLLAVVGGSDSRAAEGTATARGFGIQVVIPNQPASGTALVTAPPDTLQVGSGAFVYPADGSAVNVAGVTSSVTGDDGPTASASADIELSGLSLFGGEITATTVSSKVAATATADQATGVFDGSAVNELVVLGQPVTVTPGQQVPLADWGTLTALAESGTTTPGTPPSYHGFITALDVKLTLDHGGLPAGTDIQIGYGEVTAAATPVPTEPTTTAAPPTTTAPPPVPRPPPHQPKPPEPKKPTVPGPYKAPPNVHPKLTAGGYVFPVYGPVSFVDTFGSPRADVSYHHGDDLFAPLGAPVLAGATGTVFSVGWNEIGGNRLWVRDAQGNEFYYAHLSAYTPLARNGAQVQAGDVLGFVGNTGDAEGTPYHLHFEIHPVGRLYLGYDGAVDPTAYLTAWEHLQDLRFDAGSGWTPVLPRGAPAPKAGAFLLQASDISTASGLDPDSLARALAPVSSEGDGALLRTRDEQLSATRG
jgi:murein DD-endopeptidase MepM/ murein hydrolase activator NlpD